MTTLTDIQFTPSQQAELNNQDPNIIQAWLEILDTTPGIKSPAGWLLAAIRTGQPPSQASDVRERLAVQRAERLIRNVGANIHTEDELIAAIFNPPALTADIPTLEAIAANLTPDQHAILGPTLQAQLAYTRTHQRRTIPETGGPLHHHDTPQLRERITRLWREQRDAYEQAERQRDERARAQHEAELEALAIDKPDEPSVDDIDWTIGDDA